MELWLYGDGKDHPLLKDYPFRVFESVQKVAADDMVFAMDTIGVLEMQELLNRLNEQTRLFVITQTQDRQKAKRWSEMGASGVVHLSILAEYLEELTGHAFSHLTPTIESHSEELSKASVAKQQVAATKIPQIPKKQFQSTKRLPRLAEVEEPKRFLRMGKQNSRKHPRSHTMWENDRAMMREEFQESRGNFAGKIVAITSAKGRVGKTSFAANAAQIAASNGKRVLVIETDVTGTLSSLILHQPRVIVSDMFHLREFGTIQEFIDKEIQYGFDAMFAGEDGATCDEDVLAWLKRELETLRKKYDLILIDTSPEHNVFNMEMIRGADRVLFFVQPDVELHERNGERYRLLITPFPEGYGIEPECVDLVFSRVNKKFHKYEDKMELARYFHHEPLIEIPEYADMYKFVRLGTLISSSKPHHGYSKKIHQILEEFVYLASNKQRKWGFR